MVGRGEARGVHTVLNSCTETCSERVPHFKSKTFLTKKVYLHNCLQLPICPLVTGKLPMPFNWHPWGPVRRAFFSRWRPGRFCHVTREAWQLINHCSFVAAKPLVWHGKSGLAASLQNLPLLQEVARNEHCRPVRLCRLKNARLT